MPLPIRSLWVAVLGVLALWLIPAVGEAASRTSLYDTFLISRAADRGFPNGPSTGGVISQDARIARAVAFQSEASNIVWDDENGATDVFVVERAPGYGPDGTPWQPGRTRMISRTRSGRPANGPSYAPAISGDASSSNGREETGPRCVAFISRASNLVSGDTNGKADAFVWWFSTGRIQRVSVSTSGRQANGDSYEVAVDGSCDRIAFSSTATNLAQTGDGGRRRPNLAGLRTRRPRPGVAQIYVRVPGAERRTDRGLVGVTFLASASARGVPANGHSFDPSWSLRTSQVLTFSSAATNLDRRDRTPATDVYVKAMRRVLRTYRIGGAPRKLPTLRTALRVVSVNGADLAGNGASGESRASDQSCFVIFRTSATDVIAGDTSPSPDIVRADIRGFLRARGILDGDPAGCQLIDGPAPAGDRIAISEAARGNAPSGDPEVAGGGQYVTFTSWASTFPGVTGADADTNGVADAFLWTGVRDVVRTISADTVNRGLLRVSHGAFPSQRVNYLLFETDYLFADVALILTRYRDALRIPPRYFPFAGISNQIYMRYLGPKTVPDPIDLP